MLSSFALVAATAIIVFQRFLARQIIWLSVCFWYFLDTTLFYIELRRVIVIEVFSSSFLRFVVIFSCSCYFFFVLKPNAFR